MKNKNELSFYLENIYIPNEVVEMSFVSAYSDFVENETVMIKKSDSAEIEMSEEEKEILEERFETEILYIELIKENLCAIGDYEIREKKTPKSLIGNSAKDLAKFLVTQLKDHWTTTFNEIKGKKTVWKDIIVTIEWDVTMMVTISPIDGDGRGKGD